MAKEKQEEEKTKLQLITNEQYVSLKLDTILEELTELKTKIDELTKLAKE